MRIEELTPQFDIRDTFDKGVGFTNISFADENKGGEITKMISININKLSREDKNKFLSDFDKKANTKMQDTFGEQTGSVGAISNAKKTLYETNHIDTKKIQDIDYLNRTRSYGQSAEEMYRIFDMETQEENYRRINSANVEGILTEAVEETAQDFGIGI